MLGRGSQTFEVAIITIIIIIILINNNNNDTRLRFQVAGRRGETRRFSLFLLRG